MTVLDALRIPIWRESRVTLERAALQRDPVLRGDDVPHGDGGSVLLIPGFLAGDTSLGLMARWLRTIGHRPARARMWANVDCTTRSLGRLEDALDRLTDRDGGPVAIVGHSRGGALGRLLAVRRPDQVRRVVTLGTPMLDELAIHPLVRAQIVALGTLGTLGVPGLFSRTCGSGACCAGARDQARAPLAGGIDLVSVYSRSDGVVDWRACLAPEARHVEVDASHIGMAVNRHAYRAIAEAVAPG